MFLFANSVTLPALSNTLGGGRVLGLEKGTNCGPTTAERWLLRPEMAKKKRGCPLIIL